MNMGSLVETRAKTTKWRLQPVRRCCKGSIITRVMPAFMRITINV